MTGTIRALLTAILLLSWATPSIAITREQKVKVRELVKEGGELANHGRFPEARDRLMAALELARVPAVALYAARAHESLRELLKAAELYRLASEMPLDEALWDNDQTKTQFQLRSREEAKVALQQLLERNCTVRLQLVGAASDDIQVTLDGVALDGSSVAYELPVNPGSHVVAVVKGATLLSQAVSLDRGEHKTVTFDLTPQLAINPHDPGRFGALAPLPRAHHEAKAARTPSRAAQVQAASGTTTHSAREYLTWMAYGVGAAGFGAGIVAGIVTLDKRANLISEGCSAGGTCPTNSRIHASNLESYNRWRTVTTVGFIVGGVGAVAGLTLTLTKPKSERSSQLTLVLAPNAITAHGTF